MTATLTPTQMLLIWGLVGRGGRSPLAELAPKPSPEDRTKLLRAGLLDEVKHGRALHLALTAAGWRGAAEALRAPLPPNQAVLQGVLGRLAARMSETGASFEDLFGPPPAPEPPPAPTKPARKKPLGVKALRARIETAYLDLTGGRRAEMVRLSRLRARLDDLGRKTVDAGLARILKGDKTMRLTQLSDNKDVDAAEREAAFAPAGEPFHLLWIEA